MIFQKKPIRQVFPKNPRKRKQRDDHIRKQNQDIKESEPKKIKTTQNAPSPKTDPEIEALTDSLQECAIGLNQAIWVEFLEAAKKGNLQTITRHFKNNRKHLGPLVGFALIQAYENKQQEVVNYLLQHAKVEIKDFNPFDGPKQTNIEIMPSQLLWCYRLSSKQDISSSRLTLDPNKTKRDISLK